MTPEKRLDQIEPELAEVIQKVDRLIESNGKIVELVLDAKAELSETKETVNRIDNDVAALKVTGESTARAVANLTVTTQQQFEKVDDRFNKIDDRFGQVDDRFNKIDDRFEQVDDRFDDVDDRFDGVDTRFNKVDDRFDGVDIRFDEVSTRFDQVNTRFDELEANQNDMRQDIAELKMGQALILQILREKLP